MLATRSQWGDRFLEVGGETSYLVLRQDMLIWGKGVSSFLSSQGCSSGFSITLIFIDKAFRLLLILRAIMPCELFMSWFFPFLSSFLDGLRQHNRSPYIHRAVSHEHNESFWLLKPVIARGEVPLSLATLTLNKSRKQMWRSGKIGLVGLL